MQTSWCTQVREVSEARQGEAGRRRMDGSRSLFLFVGPSVQPDPTQSQAQVQVQVQAQEEACPGRWFGQNYLLP